MSHPAEIPLHIAVEHPDLLIGVAYVSGHTCQESSGELLAFIEQTKEHAPAPADATRQAVRQLLKWGGFKASGRNKPASEYLVEARERGEWPVIFDAVDLINVLSLQSGFPISLLDLEKVQGPFEVRLGHEGERYVFNHAGHEIDCHKVLGVAEVGGAMVANAVKDSMRSKVALGSKTVMAVIYASSKVTTPEALLELSQQFSCHLGGGFAAVLSPPRA